MTYEMHLLIERKEAKEEGRAEGKAEERENIVLRLLRMGLPFVDIQKATELPLQRIRELAEKISATDTAAKAT